MLGSGLNLLVVWYFGGGLPPFLSPHPCPSPTPSLSETLKAFGEGDLVGFAFPFLRTETRLASSLRENWYFFSHRRACPPQVDADCRYSVPRSGSPRLGFPNDIPLFCLAACGRAKKGRLVIVWPWACEWIGFAHRLVIGVYSESACLAGDWRMGGAHCSTLVAGWLAFLGAWIAI